MHWATPPGDAWAAESCGRRRRGGAGRRGRGGVAGKGARGARRIPPQHRRGGWRRLRAGDFHREVETREKRREGKPGRRGALPRFPPRPPTGRERHCRAMRSSTPRDIVAERVRSRAKSARRREPRPQGPRPDPNRARAAPSGRSPPPPGPPPPAPHSQPPRLQERRQERVRHALEPRQSAEVPKVRAERGVSDGEG